MASIAAVSSTNQGISTAHPNYSVNVSIPTPASGAADDVIIVLLGYRAPRRSDGPPGGLGPLPTVLGASAAGLGLAATPATLASDQVTLNHGVGHYVFYAFRSDFVGGSLTFSTTAITATAGELYVNLTTIVVDGSPGAVVDFSSGGFALTGSSTAGRYDNVGVTGDFNVQMMTDSFSGSAVSLSPAGSFTLHTSRVLTGTSAVDHRIGIATATDPASNGFMSGVNEVITNLGFAGPAPPAPPRGRRGFGLIHGPR